MLPASPFSVLQERVGDIIAVAHPKLVRMGRAHAVAAVIVDAAGQNACRAPEPHLAGDRVGGYLAPDIVEAIIEGRQPRSMTVKRLLQGIPCVWADQHAAFGFAR